MAALLQRVITARQRECFGHTHHPTSDLPYSSGLSDRSLARLSAWSRYRYLMTSDETVARPVFVSGAGSLFSSRIWANSPASSQYPPQLGHSSTSTLRLALKKCRLSLMPAQRGHSRLRAASTCTRSSRRIFSK